MVTNVGTSANTNVSGKTSRKGTVCFDTQVSRYGGSWQRAVRLLDAMFRQGLDTLLTRASLDDSEDEEFYFDLVGSGLSTPSGGASVMDSSFSSTTTAKSASTVSSEWGARVHLLLRNA